MISSPFLMARVATKCNSLVPFLNVGRADGSQEWEICERLGD